MGYRVWTGIVSDIEQVEVRPTASLPPRRPERTITQRKNARIFQHQSLLGIATSPSPVEDRPRSRRPTSLRASEGQLRRDHRLPPSRISKSRHQLRLPRGRRRRRRPARLLVRSAGELRNKIPRFTSTSTRQRDSIWRPCPSRGEPGRRAARLRPIAPFGLFSGAKTPDARGATRDHEYRPARFSASPSMPVARGPHRETDLREATLRADRGSRSSQQSAPPEFPTASSTLSPGAVFTLVRPQRETARGQAPRHRPPHSGERDGNGRCRSRRSPTSNTNRARDAAPDPRRRRRRGPEDGAIHTDETGASASVPLGPRGHAAESSCFVRASPG